MLVVRRKLGERILIGDEITIKVLEVERGEVSLGIDAPPDTLPVRRAPAVVKATPRSRRGRRVIRD